MPSDLLCLSCSKNSRALEEATRVFDGISQQTCHDFFFTKLILTYAFGYMRLHSYTVISVVTIPWQEPNYAAPHFS